MSREAGSRPSVTVPSFGEHGYSKEEQYRLQRQLGKKLGPSLISQRLVASEGRRIAYIETWKVIALANELFGFNGWSNSLTSQTIDFVDESDDGLYHAGVNSCVRVTLRDGTYHEDIGNGAVEGAPSKGVAIAQARKESAADGLKRCLRSFGNALGNCLGDKHYLQWVVNQWDTQPTPSANPSSDNLVSQLLSTSRTTQPASENTATAAAATTVDLQQQFLQLQQQQNPLACFQAAAHLGQATLPQQQHQQQIPLLAPFALAATSGSNAAPGGQPISSPQQLFLVRPVAAQNAGLGNTTGLLTGNSVPSQRQCSHQVHRLHGISSNATKTSSSACSNAQTVQGSLPITIQSGNSSTTSGVQTVMTNNLIQPLMANHVQSGMLNLQTALSNSHTNFLSLQNGITCCVPNNLQNAGQSSITNLVLQNGMSHNHPKSAESTVSSSKVHKPTSSCSRNTFAKPCPLSKIKKSAVKPVPQYPTPNIAPRSSASSNSSEKTGTGVSSADIARTTQSCVPRSKVAMPPLEKTVSSADTSPIKSNHGDSGKGKKRSRTRSNHRETFPSDPEPRPKKASIPLVTIHTHLDPKNDLLEVKQEPLDEEDISSPHSIIPLKNCEVVMSPNPLRTRGNSPKENHDAMEEEEPFSSTTFFEQLDRSVVADALSKLYEEGANEKEMDFDHHSDTLRKEVENQRLSQLQMNKTETMDPSPEVVHSSTEHETAKGDSLNLHKGSKKKARCETLDKTMPDDPNLRKEVHKNMPCKTRDRTGVGNAVMMDSGRSPKKVSVHIKVSVAHEELTGDKMELKNELVDLPNNTSPTNESRKPSCFNPPASPGCTVRCDKSDKKGVVADEEYLEATDVLVSKKESSRSLRSVKDCSPKMTSRLRKGSTKGTEKECNSKCILNPVVKKKSILKDARILDTEEVETSTMSVCRPLLSKEPESTDKESKTKQSLENKDVSPIIGTATRSSVTKDNLSLQHHTSQENGNEVECMSPSRNKVGSINSPISQKNGPEVESTSESKNKVSSIIKRVDYEKATSPCLGDDDVPVGSSCKDDSSLLKEADPASLCKTKPEPMKCSKVLFKPSDNDLGECVQDTEELNSNENTHNKSDKNSNNQSCEKTNGIVPKEENETSDMMSDEEDLLLDIAPSNEDASPTMDVKPRLLPIECKEIFDPTSSSMSEDENTFMGFTADMCLTPSPKTRIDLQRKINHEKLPVDAMGKEKEKNSSKLDRQQRFRRNLRIKFKESSGGRVSTKKSAAAADRRTTGATTHKLTNGHQSDDSTAALPNQDDVESSDIGEGVDQFATSLGLTPRHLLSDSPVTPPSAFLPEILCSVSRKRAKIIPETLLPSSNTKASSGDSSCNPHSTTPLGDASSDSSSKPSEGLDISNSVEKEDLTSLSDTENTASIPALEATVGCSVPFSSVPSSILVSGDDSSKNNKNTSTDNKNESFSIEDSSSLPSKPRNPDAMKPNTVESDSFEKAHKDCVDTKRIDLNDTFSKEGVAKNTENNSLNGGAKTIAVSPELDEVSSSGDTFPDRLATNKGSGEENGAVKIPVSCMETQQSTLGKEDKISGNTKEINQFQDNRKSSFHGNL